MRQGSKYRLFIVIISLLIAAAASAIVLMIANYQVVRYADKTAPNESIFLWIAIDSISYTCYFVPFNVAHWLFSFEYFSIAKIMPLVLKADKSKQTDTERRLAILKWIILVVNVLAAIASGLLLYLDNLVYFNHPKEHLNAPYAWGFVYAQNTQYLLLIVSGLFTLYAVYYIKWYISQGLKPKQINEKNLILHSTAFIAYLCALIFDAAFFINYQVKGTYASYTTFIEVQAVGSLFNLIG